MTWSLTEYAPAITSKAQHLISAVTHNQRPA